MATGYVNKNGVLTNAGMMIPGQTVNLALEKVGNVLTVRGDGGVALSASNPGYICVPSTTAGQNVIMAVTANATLEDDAGSEQITGRWGTTASVAWANNMPFFLYYVNKDNATGYFALSRDPRATLTPEHLTAASIRRIL